MGVPRSVVYSLCPELYQALLFRNGRAFVFWTLLNDGKGEGGEPVRSGTEGMCKAEAKVVDAKRRERPANGW